MTKLSEGHGHTLGPHVVGQRVVVRRVVPGETGPTGGPAFTDLLGICESWGTGPGGSSGTATIRTADGTLVEFALADVVSGKPVPPRPSARQRVGVREAESHAGPFWPGVVRQALGDWELRSDPAPSDRLVKRANSALAVDDPGLPFPDAEQAVRDFYAARDRQALVQVELDGDLESAFVAAGWTPVDGDSAFLLGSVSAARRALSRGEDADLSVDGPRLDAHVPGGRGRAAVDGDWLGIHDLAVEEGERRRGLAKRLLRALLEGGAEQGATHVWLHVELGNAPALRLYESLGLVEHHRCRYLRAR